MRKISFSGPRDRETRQRRPLLVCGIVAICTVGLPEPSQAHDVRLQLSELHQNAQRVYETLSYLKKRPIKLVREETVESHRRALGAAGIEKAMNNDQRAISILMARLEHPSFKTIPQYVDGLLMASELLESHDDSIGSMLYAAEALSRGGSPGQMAEAGARWFRGARRTEVVNQRLATFKLWSDRRKEAKGSGAQGLDHAAMYEVAYALKRNGEFEQAQKILSKIPSSSPYGSRSAYLVDVNFIEKGNLTNAERWFEAVMRWPLPAYVYTDEARAMETKVRELAALATGRLRYERGALEEASKAYRMIPAESALFGEACYEQTFLNLDRKRQRGALRSIQCAKQLGVGGKRHIDVILMQASLLAHLGQYTDSLESYKEIEAKLLRLQRIATETVQNIEDPMLFLFSAMERNATNAGDEATPGPPLFFGDLWDEDVNQLYRLYSGLQETLRTTKQFELAVTRVEERLKAEDVFPDLQIRRQHFRILLRDIQHLQGHAADISMGLRNHQGDSGGGLTGTEEKHSADLSYSLSLEKRLSSWAKIAETEMLKLDREESDVLASITKKVGLLKTRNATAHRNIEQLSTEVRTLGAKVTTHALEKMLRAFQDGVMRARVGVLDTYWVRKEHVSQKIKTILNKKDDLNKAYDAAINAMSDDKP